MSSRLAVQDVAVVGAGVAGVYSAWRLQQQADSGVGRHRVGLYEISERIGGRLLSVAPPGMPRTRVELGGMRFPLSHRLVHALVERLGLVTVPFEVNHGCNIAYLRGRRLRVADLVDPDKLPYGLNARERAGIKDGITAMAARHLLESIFKKPIADLGGVAWDELARSVQYDGHKLFDLTMRQVFDRSVSREAYQFAQDSSGYDCIYSTWNAADGFPWKLSGYGQHVEYRSLVQGYESLPQAMVKQFLAQGGELNLQHQLLSFDRVQLDDGSTAIELKFLVRGECRSVVARQLILAMPRRSLESLAPTGAVLGPDQVHVSRLIRSVQPIPLRKLALCYRQRWWEQLGITQGRSVTDLPIRQCYYKASGDGSDAGFVLIYNDGLGSDALDVAARSDQRPFPTSFAADAAAMTPWPEYAAPTGLVMAAHRQLMTMHGLQPCPDLFPYAAAYRDWGDDLYGGGANFWPRHVNSQEVARKIMQPVPDLPVYICGEAYSHAQGWVEGALATAEQVLQRYLGLQDPSVLRDAKAAV